jgi:hypothetical protein
MERKPDMFADETLDTLRRLKALDQKEQRWVWDVATILHNEGWITEACFKAALDAAPFDLENASCDACGRLAIYPRDHAFDCPLADTDDPAYAAHCILTEPEGSNDHRENLMHP